MYLSSRKSNIECVCGKSMTCKNPPNLKQHLRAVHSAVMDDILRKKENLREMKAERDMKKVWNTTSSQCLKNCLLDRLCMAKTMRYKAITQMLAIFVGSSSVTNRLMENLEFKDLPCSLDPQHPVPGRASIKIWIKCSLSWKHRSQHICRLPTSSAFTATYGLRKGYVLLPQNHGLLLLPKQPSSAHCNSCRMEADFFSHCLYHLSVHW